MSLTGHLDVFPLEEVLRLLSRSYKTGCLRIDTPEQHGRVYLDSGSLTFATVATDDEFRRQLVASSIVNEEGLRGSEVGGRSVTEVLTPASNTHLLTDLVREEVIESLYRIRKPGRGQFVFNVDVNPRYRLDQSFDVEMCVAEADRRAADWADIELTIPSIDLTLRINGEAPDGEPVTLAPNAWKLIAAFDGTASVRGLSDRLGISRFRVAKELTGLVRAGLIEVEVPEEKYSYNEIPAPSFSSPAETPLSEPTAFEPPVTPEEPSYGWAPPPAAQNTPQAVATEPASTVVPDPDRSWWEEPVEPGRQATDQEPVAAEAPAEEEQATLSESFLDRVFSQLEEQPEGQAAETEETPSHEPGALGHGFLKRRRMSSIGLDDV